MFSKKDKTTMTPDPAHDAPSEFITPNPARPEIRIPAELAPYYEAAHAAADKASGTDSIYLKSIVRGHVAAALLPSFGAVIPDSVRRPGPMDNLTMPADQYQDWLERYRESETAERKYGDEYRTAVGELVEQIMSDRHRLDAFDVHQRALYAAGQTKRNADQAEQSRANRTKQLTCPICGELNGEIAVRPVFAAAGQYARSARLRSCLPCYESAHVLLAARVGAEEVAGGRTRADIVGAWLDVNTPPHTHPAASNV